MAGFLNKRILITGASKGLGAVAAKAFADWGAKLVLMARSGDVLEELRLSCRVPSDILTIPLDLMDIAQLCDGVEKAHEYLGEIDVVIHAVGGGLGLRNELLSYHDLLRLFTLNLGIAVEINRLVAPAMKKRRSGNLVHVGSIASKEGVGSVGYNTVKAGLAAYVRSLGRELAAYHVVVTGILPGGFTGPRNAMKRLEVLKPDVYQRFVEDRLPRKIMGDAKELIPMLALLCSEDASMMGGCMVPIDAGEGRAYSV